MIEAIIDGDGIGAYEALSKIEELSPEYDVILKSLISILHKASIEKVLNNSTDTDIKNLAANIDVSFVSFYMRLQSIHFQNLMHILVQKRPWKFVF